jgi:hypothetical protein
VFTGICHRHWESSCQMVPKRKTPDFLLQENAEPFACLKRAFFLFHRHQILLLSVWAPRLYQISLFLPFEIYHLNKKCNYFPVTLLIQRKCSNKMPVIKKTTKQHVKKRSLDGKVKITILWSVFSAIPGSPKKIWGIKLSVFVLQWLYTMKNVLQLKTKSTVLANFKSNKLTVTSV